MIIRDYEKGDVFKILLHENEQYQLEITREDILMSGVAFTGLHEDHLVGSAGMVEIWPGVYEAWIALDERYKRDHISLLKMLKRSLDNLPTAHRVHAHMNINTENYKKLMEFLGFEKEATLKNFFPDKSDCDLYRRLY